MTIRQPRETVMRYLLVFLFLVGLCQVAGAQPKKSFKLDFSLYRTTTCIDDEPSALYGQDLSKPMFCPRYWQPTELGLKERWETTTTAWFSFSNKPSIKIGLDGSLNLPNDKNLSFRFKRWGVTVRWRGNWL